MRLQKYLEAQEQREIDKLLKAASRMDSFRTDKTVSLGHNVKLPKNDSQSSGATLSPKV